MKKAFAYCLTLLLLFISAKCKKKNSTDNPYGLPNATNSGMNTFACLINGKTFIAYNDIFHLGASFKNDSLYLGGSPKMGRYSQSITFLIKSSPATGQSYPINNNSVIGTIITDSTCQGIQFSIFQFQSVSGMIQLNKLDTLKRIVSGIFDCIVPIPGCDTLKITNGRFDILYHE